jgi:hypothetical protein
MSKRFVHPSTVSGYSASCVEGADDEDAEEEEAGGRGERGIKLVLFALGAPALALTRP